jgi:acyl CoA:acetate/3-ketoacid CoA transferase beta subunit
MNSAEENHISAVQRRQVDQMVVAMTSIIEDGDLLAEGIGTFLPTSAYMLAKLTHAPHCTSLCPNGNTLMPGTRALTLGHDEFSTVAQASVWLDYVSINLMYMPSIFIGNRLRWTEFMRPAQIDASGATNNICIGPYVKPKIRLPGAAGIPDATTVAHRLYYYLPRHTRQQLVTKLDFCSGAGHSEEGEKGDLECVTLVTNLCVMSSTGARSLYVSHLHPGVTREEVEDNTGFKLEWAASLAVTPAPTPKQLELLNTIVDPDGLRFLEILSGVDRKKYLRKLSTKEVHN